MFHAATTLDYQTVFQILGTFEGFSIWKGARFFRGGKSAIDFGISDKVDQEVIKARWAAMMESNPENLEREISSIFWMLKWKKFKAVGFKCWLRICLWFWKAIHFLHRFLVFLLCVTPILTIPALSLSYLLQIGCKGTEFSGGECVYLFIAVKTVCYGICWVLAKLLAFHVKVAVPASDDDSNILSP